MQGETGATGAYGRFGGVAAVQGDRGCLGRSEYGLDGSTTSSAVLLRGGGLAGTGLNVIGSSDPTKHSFPKKRPLGFFMNGKTVGVGITRTGNTVKLSEQGVNVNRIENKVFEFHKSLRG